MPYALLLKESAERELEALDTPIRRRVVKTIEGLAHDPRPPGAEMLKGGEGELRVRVGDYRIIYRVEDERLVVLVIRIGHQSDVYRRR